MNAQEQANELAKQLAHKLKSEFIEDFNDALAQLVALITELDTLKKQNEDLVKDKEMLDWLCDGRNMENFWQHFCRVTPPFTEVNGRAAISAEMKG